MSQTIYLVTGANRGIGKAFTAQLLQRPNSTVVAAVRTPSKAEPLNELPKGKNTKLIIVKIDASSDTDPAEAIATLQRDHAITTLDVVIANAGVAYDSTRILDSKPSTAREIFDVNTIGPVTLAGAVAPLLKKSNKPVFAVISSLAGGISAQKDLIAFGFPFSPYGASKAAVNWLLHRLHFEEEWLTAISFHPGMVLTDMAAAAGGPDFDLVAAGAIQPDDSAGQMLKVLDGANREQHGGKFLNYDGAELPW
ncbi:hypothetical protein B9Z65_3570 [Elsinoe australis]|uniref:Norsolorinic acid ketoreductase n=1 Tax=Elsinoe australis TaxID=40998 RepID=A0A2P8AFK8_9PEZI|nr:hypothetical protein B9Z65_3570 [Elsinoe australis]